MTVSGSAEQNFGLSSEHFAQLQKQLVDGDDELFQRIFLNQFTETQHYLIKEDGATADDAYDATMEALLKLRAGLCRGSINYGNLRFLFTRMARQQLYKAGKTKLTSLTGAAADLPEMPEVAIEEATYKLLARGWNSLGDRCRRLLLATFYQNKTAEEISQLTSTLPATVRKQKQRCIEKLRSTVLSSPLRAEH